MNLKIRITKNLGMVCLVYLGALLSTCHAQNIIPVKKVDASSVREDLKSIARILWNREPTIGEVSVLVEADKHHRQTDLIQYFASWRQYEELLNSSKLVDKSRPSQLQLLRHRHGALLYFDKASALGDINYASLKSSLAADPLVATMFEEDPVILEDHQSRVLVTEDHIRIYKKAYSFFGEICGATEAEIDAGKKNERADTIKNFGNAESENRTFFATTAAQITAQMEAWKIASDELKQHYQKIARENYKDRGFWSFVADLNEMEKLAFNQVMIQPSERVAEFPTFFLVNTEVEWACQLVEVASGKSVSSEERIKLQKEMKADFEKFADGTELNALDRERKRFLDASSPALRSDYRLAHLKMMLRPTAAKGELGNFLTRINRPRPIVEDRENGVILTQWHLDSLAKWMQMVAWLGGARAPTQQEVEEQQKQFVERFKSSPIVRPFFESYPLFVDDALAAWIKIPADKRMEIRKETRELYVKHGLANASYPLSKISLAERKKRVDGGLEAFGKKLVDMQIQAMQQQLIFQAQAGVLNTMSETGAIMAAGPDAQIWGGGGANLMIDGNIHQYPVEPIFIAGQYGALASMAESSRVLLESEVKKANQRFAYFKSIRDVVASGGLAGFDESVLPPLPENDDDSLNDDSLTTKTDNSNGATTKGMTKSGDDTATTPNVSLQDVKTAELSKIPYQAWAQNKLQHPDGVEFIEPGTSLPRRMLEFPVSSLEKASSGEIAEWGKSVDEKLIHALSIASVDVMDSALKGSLLSGEGITEHGDCSFLAEFVNNQSAVRILIVPSKE